METQTQEDFFKESKEELRQYLQNRIWLLKLQAGEKTAQVTALVVTLLVIGLFAFFVLLFLSIMAGYYFSERLQSQYLGFGMVAGFYTLLLLLLLLARKKIMARLADIVIVRLFEKNEDPENEKQ